MRRSDRAILPRREMRFGAASAAGLFYFGRGMNAMAAPAMITRPIPSSGEAMQIIGLGTWSVFDVGDDARKRAPLKDVVRRLGDDGGRMVGNSAMVGREEAGSGDLDAD